jgi:molybdenum cofactor synthesis domain-containing protein
MAKPDDELLIGLVSVSDRASQGIYEDQGIPALREWFERALTTPWRMVSRLIPDEQPVIEATLRELVDDVGCHLVLTTGGTGPAPRDVTPEATLAVADKVMPGFGEQMRQVSLKFVPTAILSRQVAVIRKGALIINLPGQPKAIRETLEGLKDENGQTLVSGIFAAVPYCIDLIGGPYIETNEEVVKAFRPKSAIRQKSWKRFRASLGKGSGRFRWLRRGDTRGISEPNGLLNMTEKLLETIEIETARNPAASVIWMHGLGADGNDFVPIVRELDLEGMPAIRFVFPHAPMRPVTINNGYVMRAWYDVSYGDLEGRSRRADEQGVRESGQAIARLIERELDRGISSGHIVLAGFSQGGAMALHTGLRYPQPLAGIMALSTYLPLAESLAAEAAPANAGTPIFMAHGTLDPVVPYAMGAKSRDLLARLGYEVEWHEYPMPHSVCLEEIQAISAWLRKVLG